MQIFKVCDSLKYNQKIVFSDEYNLKTPKDVYDIKQDRKTSIKPDGLWYSFGSIWIEYLYSVENDPENNSTWAKERLELYSHVYKLLLNKQRMITIKTLKEFDEFSAKYANKHKEGIFWSKVQRDGYDGIEIRYQIDRDWGDKRSKCDYWYWYWDVSCGCVWNPRAIKKIELLETLK